MPSTTSKTFKRLKTSLLGKLLSESRLTCLFFFSFLRIRNDGSYTDVLLKTRVQHRPILLLGKTFALPNVGANTASRPHLKIFANSSEMDPFPEDSFIFFRRFQVNLPAPMSVNVLSDGSKIGRMKF